MNFECWHCGASPRELHQLWCPFASSKIELTKVTEENQSGGRKDDQGKLRYDLIPPEATDALAWILMSGASKYGDRNWEQGMRWGRPFAALMRHMWAWWRSEHTDPETGKSHLWHALACLAFLITFEARQIGEDDRP